MKNYSIQDQVKDDLLERLIVDINERIEVIKRENKPDLDSRMYELKLVKYHLSNLKFQILNDHLNNNLQNNE